MKDVIVCKEKTAKLIPQRPPIVMIDSLVANDDFRTVTCFHVEADNIFCENGFLNESGLIENIAQTAAVRSGYLADKMNVPVPLGFIAGIKNLVISKLPPVNSDIMTEIEIVDNVMGITIIKGRSSSNGYVLAECEMKIFIEKNSLAGPL